MAFNDGVEFRECDAADLVSLRDRWPVAGDVHEAHFQAQHDQAATYLVAWDGPDPLGSAMIQWRGCIGGRARARYPGCVELNHLQVRAELRGRGTGTGIIRAAEQLARSRGAVLLGLSVALDNPDNRRLYHRLGYRPTEVLDSCDYSWVDDSGRTHQVHEVSELLVKALVRPDGGGAAQ